MYQLYWTQTAACHTGRHQDQGQTKLDIFQHKLKILAFLNRYSLFWTTFHSNQSLPLRLSLWKHSETLLQAAVKSWAGKGNLIFCLFKRSEIHTTMDKLIQNVPLMQVCLSALLIDARMILTHWRVGGTLWISFMTVHKLKWLGLNTSNSLMTHLFYDLFVLETHHITRNIFILSL